MADAKWWQVYGTTPNQKEKADALYRASAYMPLGDGLKGNAARAADAQEQRGITQNRVKQRYQKQDETGRGRHGYISLKSKKRQQYIRSMLESE